MNALVCNLASAGRNPHVSIPVLLAIGLSLAEIWVPERFDKQLQKTERVLLGYGIIAAGNSGPSKKDPNDNKD